MTATIPPFVPPVMQATDYEFKFASAGIMIAHDNYLIDPWLPRATVIGVYGRGESGKSSWCATACAIVSRQVSALWVTSEEPHDWILARHIACGGDDNTLAINVAQPIEFDPRTNKPIRTTFNAYKHLEPAIEALKLDPRSRQDRPLGVVVLDAIVALVDWPRGVSANDDGGVKKLITFLMGIAERHNVTILMLGHLNKRTTSEHIADSVTGAAAWTNSVRLGFMFKKDPDEEHQGFIRTVKNNAGTHFGTSYRTTPVLQIKVRPDGRGQFLCRVDMHHEIAWGEVALREAMSEDDDDEWLNRREQKRNVVQLVVERVLQELQTAPAVTRERVQVLVGTGTNISRRYWLAADKELVERGVRIMTSAHGAYVYSRADQTQG